MPKKIKKKNHHTPKIPPFVTNSADLRLLHTVGKGTFIKLAGKKIANWGKYLRMTTFIRKGKICKYTTKSIGYKHSAMTRLYHRGLIPYLLFDIYYRPSRIDIKKP